MHRLSRGVLTGTLTAIALGALAQEVSVNVGVERSVQIADNRRNPGEMNAIAVGDLDGDGSSDLIVGAPRASGFLTVDSGMVYVRFGANYWDDVPPSLDDQGMYYDFTAPPNVISNLLYSSVTIEDALGRVPSGIQVFSERAGEAFGSSVAAGDFNGDNFADLVIGSPAPFGSKTGAVYIVFGRADIGGRLNIETEIFNGRATEIFGRQPQGRFGEKLLLHDIDNDGFDDLIIGSPRNGSGGMIDVVYGTSDAIAVGTRLQIDSMPIPTTHIANSVSGERIGTGLAAGDFNNDGFAELALGAPRWPLSTQGNGRVVIVNLGNARLPVYDLALMPTYVEVRSTQQFAGIGESLAIADIDGDSVEDLVIGAPLANVGSTTNAGVVYLISNPNTSAGSTIEVPADADLTITGQKPQEFFGRGLVAGSFDSAAGADLAVGAPGSASGTALNSGAVYVYRGGTLPTGSIDRFETGLPIIRYYINRAHFELGTQLALGDFDGERELDLFMCGVGNQDFSSQCGSGVQADYDLCHASKQGVQVYGVLSGTLEEPSTGLSTKPGWMLAE